MESVPALRERIAALERELAETKGCLRYLEESSSPGKQDIDSLPLRLDEYRRYGRQMILENFGLSCVSHLSTTHLNRTLRDGTP